MNNKLKNLNITTIKIIACILMFIDHIHEAFHHVGAPNLLTWFGRPVFVLFLFATVQGWSHTSSKPRYLKRLCIASIITSILFLTLSSLLPNTNIILMNNAITTFFITALFMYAIDMFKEKKILKGIGFILLPFILSLPMLFVANQATADIVPQWVKPALAVTLTIPSLSSAEGGLVIVLLGTLLYIFRKNRKIQIGIILAVSAISMYTSGLAQGFMALSIIPILLYNGEKGKGMKYFFYIYYPLHIILLYIISTLIFGGT